MNPLSRRALIRNTVTAGGLAAAATAVPGALGAASAAGEATGRAPASVATLQTRYVPGIPAASG